MASNDGFQIHYSLGTGLSFGRAKNRTDTWLNFKRDFKTPIQTPEKLSQYLKLSDKEQIELKARNGWFYRGQVQGKRRNRRSGMPSNIVTIDLDYATPEFLEMLRLGIILPEIEYFVHSSRRHTPEKPRLRMVVLLKTPVSKEDYSAASRILAQKIDPEMVLVDKVSFRPAQMMFRPTISSDSEYVFIENKGQPYDWEAENDAWGDWHDISGLPICAGEKLRETSDKAEDPTEKQGMVGDFCRAYTIPEAIEAFDLPYEESGDADRYTFTGGTTSNGMQVYDDGLFCYSHHGSDPACDQLLNAFDLVRIHKFAALDDDVDDEAPQSQRPSWKAMQDLVRDDARYIKAVAASHYDQTAMFDDLLSEEEVTESTEMVPYHVNGEVMDPEIDEILGTPKIMLPKKARGAPVDPDWFSKLEINPRTGDIEPTIANVAMILQNDRRLRGVYEQNEFTNRIVTRRPLNSKLPILRNSVIHDHMGGDPLEDIHYSKVRAILESQNGKGKVGYGLKVTDRDLYGAVTLTAEHWPFHPIQDILSALTWDQIERLETFFIRYLGCPDDEYHREVAVKFFLAGVTRAFEPGHKFDYAPILEGAQGVRKSTMIQVIAMGFFGELKADFHDEKKLVEQMQNCFVMELPELSNFNRSSVEDMKAHISATENYVRMSYGRQPQRFLRQCIFMGSTNKETYLLDDTGNRRFWPLKVMVEQIDIDSMRREIMQVWAEAVDLYRRMRAVQPEGTLPLYLTRERAQEIAQEAQEARRQLTEADSYADVLAEWLDTPYAPDPMEPDTTILRDEITTTDIWQAGLGMNGLPKRGDTMEISKAMKRLGWSKVKLRRGSITVNGYVRPKTDGSELI
jgi:predicted P-loop ATPase